MQNPTPPSGQSAPAAKPIDEWRKIEYHQIHEYGRTVYGSFFHLAQMTFVINPALGIGIYYLFYQSSEGSKNLQWFFLPIVILGMLYNFGALVAYRQSHAFLQALLIRMKKIDEEERIETYVAVSVTAPRSYLQFRGIDRNRPFWEPRDPTEYFFYLLIAVWAASFIYCLGRMFLWWS